MHAIDEQWPIVGGLLLAAALGALIGIEREYRGYPAGIRTIALVCMGTVLFGEESWHFSGDSGRVAAQIVTGIGFLGAGVIVHEGLSVRGITTAATIWTSAGIGLAVATQLFVVAIAACLTVILLLEASPITKLVDGWGARRRGDTPNDEGD